MTKITQKALNVHQRSTTFEGDQMIFKFPSKEELANQQSVKSEELGGPSIKPYHIYQREISQTQQSESSSYIPRYYFGKTTPSEPSETATSSSITTRSESSNYFVRGHRSISSSGRGFILEQIDTLSDHFITTEDLSTLEEMQSQERSSRTPSTHRKDRLYQPQVPFEHTPRHSEAERRPYPRHFQYNKINSSGRIPSLRQSPSLRRNSSFRRSNSVQRNSSIKRYLTTIKNESESLYRRSSLKRTKAIKSKIGWLSKLKLLGHSIKTKLKNWRFISQKKMFSFSRRKRVKKTRISMPLERDTAQSISELRRDYNEWYSFKEPKIISVDAPPSARYKLVETPTIDPEKKLTPPKSNKSIPSDRSSSSPTPPIRRPPPLPEHRVASNPTIKKVIEDREKESDKRLSLFSYAPRNVELISINVQSPNMEKKFPIHDIDEDYSYPSHPLAIVDDESVSVFDYNYESPPLQKNIAEFMRETNNYTENNDDYENDDDEDVDDEEEEDDQEQELVLREYWTHYIRKVVSGRIQSKLEMHKLSNIEEPEEAQEYAENFFGLMSDTETLSDSDRTEILSISSIGTSDYSSTASTNITDSSYLTSSDASTNYYSSYGDGPLSTPEDILKYQQEFIKRYRTNDIKRASTLPNEAIIKARGPKVSIQATPRTHARFQSVV